VTDGETPHGHCQLKIKFELATNWRNATGVNPALFMKTKMLILTPVLAVLTAMQSPGAPPPPSHPPVTSSLPPITSSQPPITSSQPPITTSEPPGLSSQPAITSSQPPAGASQPGQSVPSGQTFVPGDSGAPREDYVTNAAGQIVLESDEVIVRQMNPYGSFTPGGTPVEPGQPPLPAGAANQASAQQQFEALLSHVNQMEGHAPQSQFETPPGTNDVSFTNQPTFSGNQAPSITNNSQPFFNH
jgi:hypothetical protein